MLVCGLRFPPFGCFFRVPASFVFVVFVLSSPGFVFSVFVVLFAGLPVGVPCLVAFCPLPARFQPVGACLPCLLVFWWLCLAVGSACVGVGAKLLGGGALCRGCAGCGFGLACCGGRCCAFGVVLVLRCARRAVRWGCCGALWGLLWAVRGLVALCGLVVGPLRCLSLFARAFCRACVYSMRPGGLKFSRPLQPFPAPCSIPPKRFEGDCATRSGGRCSLVLCVALGSRSRVLRLRAVFLFNLFAALFSRLNLNEN